MAYTYHNPNTEYSRGCFRRQKQTSQRVTMGKYIFIDYWNRYLTIGCIQLCFCRDVGAWLRKWSVLSWVRNQILAPAREQNLW